ncbi:DUF1441 family protein [Pseudomonas sp. QL9]|uniref:DUF1441 family protein n=1 Tax=Pseudomonas sp. QL9 TaxID=3242725 RepID=UPI00352B1E47
MWSISALAEEFGVDRRTVKRRVEGIPPAGETNGYPAWHLRDVALAVMGTQVADDPEGYDPDKLHPTDRLSQYRAEREKIKWAAEQRISIPAPEVERVVASAFQSLSQGSTRSPTYWRTIALSAPRKSTARSRLSTESVRVSISSSPSSAT